MAVLTVYRHIILRLEQPYQQLDLLCTGMSGGMNAKEYRIRYHLYSRAGQLVYYPADKFFISGDGAR